MPPPKIRNEGGVSHDHALVRQGRGNNSFGAALISSLTRSGLVVWVFGFPPTLSPGPGAGRVSDPERSEVPTVRSVRTPA